MVGYRSGQNGVDLKSIVSPSMRLAGSNPAPIATIYIYMGMLA